MKKAHVVFPLAVLLLFPICKAEAQLGFPVILSAAVDSANNTLTVSGRNFGAVSSLKFGIVQLSVTSSTADTIATQLPTTTNPGSYVIQANVSNGIAFFAISLGGPSSQGSGSAIPHGFMVCNPHSFLISSCSFTVPPGTTNVLVEAWGGGNSGFLPTSFGGSYCKAVLPVAPGHVLMVSPGAGGGQGNLLSLNGGDSTVVDESVSASPLLLAPGGGSSSQVQCPGIFVATPISTPPYSIRLPFPPGQLPSTIAQMASGGAPQSVGGNGYMTLEW